LIPFDQVLWCKCGASLAGADRWRTDAKRHASRADLHLKKRTSNEHPTGWLSPPASARWRHRYSGTDAPHSARRFHRGHVVLAVLLLTPGDYLPKVDLWDKLEHGLAFGVVAFTGAAAFPARSSLLRLGFGLPCLGALFEILQIFVPGREAAVGDALANTIGVAIGLSRS
jgi:VanZ like family